MTKRKKTPAEEEMRYPNLVAFSKCMDENGDIHDENLDYQAVYDEIQGMILDEEVDADTQFLLVAMQEAVKHIDLDLFYNQLIPEYNELIIENIMPIFTRLLPDVPADRLDAAKSEMIASIRKKKK